MDQPSVTLRACEARDVPQIAAIYRHAVATGTASFEIDPPDDEEMRRRFATLIASRHPYLVAVCQDSVAGYAYAGPYRTRPAYRGTVETSIYVDPAYKGRGIGRALLAALIAAAEAAGFRQVVAVIGDSANAASIGLHAALGFRDIGTLTAVGWKHGRWLDTVLMQRDLGPGCSTPPGSPSR